MHSAFGEMQVVLLNMFISLERGCLLLCMNLCVYVCMQGDWWETKPGMCSSCLGNEWNPVTFRIECPVVHIGAFRKVSFVFKLSFSFIPVC